MIENRELTMDDYLAMLRRRLKVILIPTLLAPLVGFAISYAFSPKYTSQSLILAEPQKVPQGYVAPVVTEDLTQRVGTLQQKALGADNLGPLIDKLTQEGVVRGSRESLIDKIRAGISIQPVQSVMVPTPGATLGNKKPVVPGFYLNFTGGTAREAQEICAGVTDIMLRENLKDRERVAQDTTDFLGRQVDDAKHDLDNLDSKLAAFKRQYLGQLPGDEDNNLKILMALNTQLDANTQNLSRAQQDKAYAESMLSQQLAAWKSSQNATNPQTLQQQLAAAQALLIQLQGRYTDDHPDVVKAKRDIADLQKQLDQLNAAASKSPSTTDDDKGNLAEPPEVRQLRVQIHQYDDVISQATRDQKKIQDQIKVLQGRVALSPAIEEQYKQLTRDYDTAQKFYDDLQTKKNNSEMQKAMERDQQGEQMQLQIPANLPDAPSFPNRLIFAGGGLGGGLALGLGLALWLELRDKSVRSEADVIALLDLPVLTQVPWVGTEGSEVNGNRRSSRSEKETVGV